MAVVKRKTKPAGSAENAATETISGKVSPRVFAKLKALATKEDRKKSYLVRKFVEEGLRRIEETT